MSAESSVLQLLRLLDAAKSRSGEDIARALGCSRSAVWKQVNSLRTLGVGVTAVAGQGYRLSESVELLDGELIKRSVPEQQRQCLSTLETLATIDSTNAELQRRPVSRQHGLVLLAERQTAGRGRHGRHWFSPLARNIYLSFGWRFETGVSELSALPLVMALAASEALLHCGHEGHAIKWPNDLLCDGRKLGGCLVEVQGDASGPCNAVMGLGLNVRMPAEAGGAEAIDQPWTDVASRLPGVSRNALAGALITSLIQHILGFERQGFEPFMAAWAEQDWLAGRSVEIAAPAGRLRGIARGISRRGGLLVDAAGERRELHAGDVSLQA